MVMWLIGLSQTYRWKLVTICSCYCKSNIVVPTCISDELPPSLPSYQCFSDKLMGDGLVQCCLMSSSRATNRGTGS